jgi:hypothetical protein
MFALVLALAAQLAKAEDQAELLDSGGRSAAEVFGIVIGIALWAISLLFGIGYYIWKCKCYKCCVFCCGTSRAMKASTV